MKNLTLFFFFLSFFGISQYWQQEIDYKIEIDFDNTNNQYRGVQKINYTNTILGYTGNKSGQHRKFNKSSVLNKKGPLLLEVFFFIL